MPISKDFQGRLYPYLDKIVAEFGTPFHIYDENGIRETALRLNAVFSDFSFREYYATKALPNPHILAILRDVGCGFDCSSIAELLLARQVGATGDDIMFTSNNTSHAEFEVALANGGAIINLDDVALLERLPTRPERISFRLNPGSDMGNSIIGKPESAKFGIPRERIMDAYRAAQAYGIQRFGLHTMVVSNECDIRPHLDSIAGLCQLAQALQHELGIRLEFINIGGGLGIPYHPNEPVLDLEAFANGIRQLWQDFELEDVALLMESGRYMTAPHGVLVTRVINRKESYRTYIGVDANMSALMRPAMYGAYHHIDVLPKSVTAVTEVVDVVGALCENNDKFAIQRTLPITAPNDLMVIHDTGAHGHAMGFNYNGRLRPQELLLRADGTVARIRRAQTLDDYFATLQFESHTLPLS